SMVTGNISTVVQSQFKFGFEKLKATFGKLLVVNIFTFSLMPIFLATNTDFIVNIFFSEQWLLLTELLPIVAVWAFIWGVSSPYSVLFHLYEKESMLFKIQCVKFITRLVYLSVAPMYLDFYYYVTGYVVVGSSIQIFQLLVLTRVIGLNVKSIILNNAKLFLIVALLIFSSIIISYCHESLKFSLSILAVLSSLYLGRNEIIYIKNNI
ncbi:hypothetical protein RCJ22_10505, partial [Vibrio sp. FNV 38]|nr:hypothetical protein [Vibrio sp. FNV 38]